MIVVDQTQCLLIYYIDLNCVKVEMKSNNQTVARITV